jgi:hypothetical protein
MLLLLSSGKHSYLPGVELDHFRHIPSHVNAVAFFYNYAVMSTTYTTGSTPKENTFAASIQSSLIIHHPIYSVNFKFNFVDLNFSPTPFTVFSKFHPRLFSPTFKLSPFKLRQPIHVQKLQTRIVYTTGSSNR